MFVRVARLVAGDMAERAGFSVDEIDDVRLAVDELCAVLIGAAGSILELRMQAAEDELVIEGRTPAVQAPEVQSELSELLLHALVDSCAVETDEHATSIVMSKRARDIP